MWNVRYNIKKKWGDSMMATRILKKLLAQFLLIIFIIDALTPLTFANSGSSSGGCGGTCGSISAPISGLTFPVTTEIISITTNGLGTTVNQLSVNTRITVNKDSLPKLKEYICIFGRNHQLKAVVITNAKTDGSSTATQIIGSFDISSDYIKILVWDDNMMPYSKETTIQLKDIPRSIPAPSGGGGWDGGSVSFVN